MTNTASVVVDEYALNTISNLDPENILSPDARAIVRRKIDPALTLIRTALNHQKRRVISAFDENRKWFTMEFPGETELDNSTSDEYRKLHYWIEEVFTETVDLEDLIEFGAPAQFVILKLTKIIDNRDFLIAELNSALPKLQWQELERLARLRRELLPSRRAERAKGWGEHTS
jgi:hypothetical protein